MDISLFRIFIRLDHSDTGIIVIAADFLKPNADPAISLNFYNKFYGCHGDSSKTINLVSQL
jgi:hypothetical protein